jgi:hypothetical protein
MSGTKFFMLLGVMSPVLTGGAGEAVLAPAQITTCTTITVRGSYVLANNLNATGDCLLLKANSVTLDLAGFTIRGNGTGTGIGSSAGTGRGITIRNGTVTNFDIGIALGLNTLIEQMHVSNNTSRGAGLTSGIVRDSAFIDNGSEGLIVSSKSLISNNNFDRNDVGLSIGFASEVIGNEAGDNAFDGLLIVKGSTVMNNTVSENGDTGIRVGCPSNVFGNTATANGVANIALEGDGCVSNFNLAP